MAGGSASEVDVLLLSGNAVSPSGERIKVSETLPPVERFANFKVVPGRDAGSFDLLQRTGDREHVLRGCDRGRRYLWIRARG